MRRTIGRWLREPLLQFMALGLLLFLGHRLVRGGDVAGTAGRIELTADDVRQIGYAWVAQGRPAPSGEEMESLIDARVREEILYREALALGLDKDDAIVRRRLAQKMEFLFEDVAALRDPEPGELRSWFDRHAEQFTLPARASFRHLYFSPDRRGERSRDDAAGALRQLAGQPMDGPAVRALGDPFMFQDYYGDRTPEDVSKTFGPGFAETLFRLAPGAWAGPIESGYGWHLVWVESTTPPRPPAFEEVEADVKTAWLEEQRAMVRDAAFAAMRARYQVVLPKELPAIELTPLAGLAPQ